MKRGVLTFGTIKSDDYDIYISGSGTHNAPREDVELIEIPGRNGDLLIRKKRFKNVEVKYPAFTFAKSAEEYAEKIREIRNALKSLKGYQRLSDTYHPDEFRMASFTAEIVTSDIAALKAGSFDLVFNCKPQRFLTEGETEIELSNTSGAAKSFNIVNPSRFPSKPLIKVTGYGTLGIGDYNIIISGTADQVLYIDCDIMDAYSVSSGIMTSQNSKVTTGADYPELVGGDNGIQLPATITNLVITPRWWVI